MLSDLEEFLKADELYAWPSAWELLGLTKQQIVARFRAIPDGRPSNWKTDISPDGCLVVQEWGVEAVRSVILRYDENEKVITVEQGISTCLDSHESAPISDRAQNQQEELDLWTEVVLENEAVQPATRLSVNNLLSAYRHRALIYRDRGRHNEAVAEMAKAVRLKHD